MPQTVTAGYGVCILRVQGADTIKASMTHVIIAHPFHDSTTEFAAAMASFSRPGDRITRVDESVDSPKGSPSATYLAAFNHFDEAAFVRAIQSVPWEYAPSVSAFVRGVAASRFETVNLQMEFDIGRNRKLAAAHGWGVPLSDDQAEFLSKTYPAVLDRREKLILDSMRNRQRHFNGYEVALSVTTESPWIFECTRVFPEQRLRSGTRCEFGTGKEDWKWISVKHRTIYADLAFHGVHCRLSCDEATVGPTTFEQVRAGFDSVGPGDHVRIVGVIDVSLDGECVIEKIGRLDKETDTSGPAGEAT